MTRVHRLDKAVRVGATPIEVRANGAKVYEGTAAFGDIVKRYPELDPPRSEFIPADEAMSPAALASLRGAIFTGGIRRRDFDGRVTLPGDHAPELSTPETAGDLLEGVVLDAWRFDPPDGTYPELKVKVIAHTLPMQALLESGTCELSLGMWAAEDLTPGVGPRCGTSYDRVQRAIIYDHLNAVGRARSRTPEGRAARLDNDPSYPHPGESITMNPEVLALIAKSLKLDALPPEDAALLAQMSPASQAALKAAAETAVAGAVAAESTMTEAGDDDVTEAATLAAIMQAVETLKTEVASMKAGGAAPKPGTPAKKDGQTLADQDTANTRTDSAMISDPAAVIEAANKAAAATSLRTYNEAAKVVGHVRKDGHSNVHTTDEAAATMLAIVKTHMPKLAAVAEAHVKAQRMDALVPMYDQAEDFRRAAMLREQEADLAGTLSSGGDYRLDAAPDIDNSTIPLFSAGRPGRG